MNPYEQALTSVLVEMDVPNARDIEHADEMLSAALGAIDLAKSRKARLRRRLRGITTERDKLRAKQARFWQEMGPKPSPIAVQVQRTESITKAYADLEKRFLLLAGAADAVIRNTKDDDARTRLKSVMEAIK